MVKPNIATYEFGTFRLDLAEHRLLRDGQAVLLTAKLFDILLLLVRDSGKVVTKETLMKEVWPNTFVEENNLTVCISALRKILGERHREHEYIETVTKRGYRFVARVREIQDVESTEQTGVRFVWAGNKTADELERAVRALAVLPLVNVGEDLDLEYLSDGITESIINHLSRLPQLRVMARNTVFRYKGRDLDARQIGRELNVPAVLIGRLRQLNKQLILGVELVNVSDGSQLWGEQYNRRFSDIFRVQAEIASEISEKLRIKLTGEERERLTKHHTENSEAYELYLKGRYFWNKRTVKDIKRGLQYFKEAIALDANFALAYAGLADCYTSLVVWNALQTTEGVTPARRAAVKALALDETLAEAHASLAFIEVLALNWSESGREFRRAIELNPNNALTRSRYAVYLAASGRLAQATTEIKQALKTDPLSPLMHTNTARILFYARQYERSIEQCHEALEIEPRFGAAYGVLGVAYEGLAKYEEAIAALRKAISLSEDDHESFSILGYVYAASGRRPEAQAVLEKLQQLSEQIYVPPIFRVWIHIALNEKEEAFEWLEKSYQERSYVLTHLNVLPVFDCLRADPRFTDLLRRLGLSD